MGFQESSAFCNYCEKQVSIRRRKANRFLQVLLTVWTLGLWIPFWLIGVRRRGWHCVDCGRPVTPLLSAELTTALCLSVATVWLAGFLVLQNSGTRLFGMLSDSSRQSDEQPAQPTASEVVRPATATMPTAAAPERTASVCLVSLQSDRISIQTAVSEICQANGLWHNQTRTKENIGFDEPRTYIQVDIKDLPLNEALAEVLLQHGLTYQIKDNELWLERAAQAPPMQN